MSHRILQLLRLYLWALGVGLLAEGAIMLALGAIPPQQLPAGLPLPEPDTLHNAIHVVWGAVIVGFMMSGLSDVGASLLALLFAAFYVPLGVLGLVVDRPFGLMLGPGQNAFHFIVGPTALLLGALGLARSHAQAAVRRPA